MIRQNIIQSFPVIVYDIDIAENIFGPDMSTLRAITEIQRSKVVVEILLKYQ